MTTLLVPWLLFPVVLGLISLGCGLLLERVSGAALPGALLLPGGLAVVVVLGLFTTTLRATASLTIPLVLAAAVLGYALSIGRKLPRAPAPIALAVGAFAVYAAPVVLTGSSTFTGYVKLDDTASFLGFTDQIMSHGRDLSGLAPSTFERLQYLNIHEGYPVGTFIPLGVGSRLVGQDPTWIYQPCMAFFAAMLALALYALLRGAVRSAWLRAAAAFVAGQAALLYAYALWGGIKELAAAAFIGLAAALVPLRREELARWRGLIPFATAAAATAGVLSVSGWLWIGLLALPAVVLIVLSPGRLWRPAAIGVGAIALLSIPSIVIAGQFLHYSSSNLFTPSERLGNLIRGLRFQQIFGIWITGDFRLDPPNYWATAALIIVCAVSAVIGVAYAARLRAWRIPLVASSCTLAAALLLLESSPPFGKPHSSPWLVGKALAEASPFVVLLALAGAALLIQSRRRVEGIVLGAAITLGVLWSNVYGYSAVWVAPRAQLMELQQIGKLYAGDGPALMTEYQPYGVRHLLRKLDAEGASELRYRQVPLIDGSGLQPGTTADLDRFRYPDILLYRTYVLRTSPVESRPGAPYRLVWHGRYYDVWQRPASGGPQVLLHVPLGNGEQPSAVPPCALVKNLAQVATRDGGVLATAHTPDPVVVPLSAANFPGGWYRNASAPETVTPTSDGTLVTSVNIPKGGGYSVWLGGFTLRDATIAVDGRKVGTVAANGSANPGIESPAGYVTLGPGNHLVTVTYGDSWFRPGATAPGYGIGPVIFAPVTGVSVVTNVPPAKAATLCGQSLDWIEIVKP
jgi:hypothetical protein